MKMNKERYEILHISEEGVAIVDKKTNEVFYGEFDLINRLQERIDNAIKYIEKETEGRDANPIEGSWLYDLLKVKEILKGGKE